MNATPTPHVNGNTALNGDGSFAAHIEGDSPTTPVSDAAPPHVKINIDEQEPESDARHEPLPPKRDQFDDSRTCPTSIACYLLF
jgi:hypothetical protein